MRDCMSSIASRWQACHFQLLRLMASAYKPLIDPKFVVYNILAVSTLMSASIEHNTSIQGIGDESDVGLGSQIKSSKALSTAYYLTIARMVQG